MEADELNDTLSVGNEHIDNQHGRIIHLVNELEASIGNKSAPEKKFFLLLSDLMLTVTRHFRDEEMLLEKNGCPWLSEQVKAHVYFVERLSAIMAMDENEVPEQVVQFMKQWLETHLSKVDMKCRPYLEEH